MIEIFVLPADALPSSSAQLEQGSVSSARRYIRRRGRQNIQDIHRAVSRSSFGRRHTILGAFGLCGQSIEEAVRSQRYVILPWARPSLIGTSRSWYHCANPVVLEITEDITVYRFSQPNLLSELQAKVTRLSDPTSYSTFRSLERGLAKDGLGTETGEEKEDIRKGRQNAL